LNGALRRTCRRLLPDEAAVDLDLVEREALQIAERGIAVIPKHVAPVARTAPPAAKAASNANAPGAKAGSKKIAAPNAAPPAAPKAMPPATAAATAATPAEQASAAIQKPEPKAESANPPTAAQTLAVAPSQPAAAPAPKELASKPPAPEVKTEAKAEIAVEKKPER